LFEGSVTRDLTTGRRERLVIRGAGVSARPRGDWRRLDPGPSPLD